jgi:hypothetical protein
MTLNQHLRDFFNLWEETLITEKELEYYYEDAFFEDVLANIQILIDESIIRVKYKVLTPSGVFADGIFDSLEDIPEMLADRFENYFLTAEAEKVKFYEKIS